MSIRRNISNFFKYSSQSSLTIKNITNDFAVSNVVPAKAGIQTFFISSTNFFLMFFIKKTGSLLSQGRRIVLLKWAKKYQMPSLLVYTFFLIYTVPTHPHEELTPPIPGFEWVCEDWDEPEVFTKDKIVVSLGSNCAAARHFQHHKLAEAYLPFDWCFSKFDSVYVAFENVFKDFLALNNLEILSSGENYHEVFDKKYAIRFIHDFKNEKQDYSKQLSALSDYDHNKTKYERRIKRLKNIFKSKKPVFFFKTIITKQEALLLRDLMCNKFPLLNFTLVAINNTEDFKKTWNELRLKNFFISDPANASVTEEMQKTWEPIFKDLQLIA